VITADDFRLLLLLLLTFRPVDSAYETELLLADVTGDVNNDDQIDDAVDPFMCDLDPAAGDVTSRSRDVNTGVTTWTGRDRWLLLLLLAFTSVDSTGEIELILVDVTDDAVDPFICDTDDVNISPAEVTTGDVTLRSGDVNAGVDMLMGSMVTVLLAFRPVDNA